MSLKTISVLISFITWLGFVFISSLGGKMMHGKNNDLLNGWALGVGCTSCTCKGPLSGPMRI